MYLFILKIEEEVCFFRNVSDDCSNEIVRFNELSEIRQLQLAAVKNDAVGFFYCKKHIDSKIKLFKLNQKSCCNPLGIHKKSVKLNLFEIDDTLYFDYKHTIILVPGQVLCVRCKKVELPNWLKEHPAPLPPPSQEFFSNSENSENDSVEKSSQASGSKNVEKEIAVQELNAVLQNFEIPEIDVKATKVSDTIFIFFSMFNFSFI